jgi:hypothetical protein
MSIAAGAGRSALARELRPHPLGGGLIQRAIAFAGTYLAGRTGYFHVHDGEPTPRCASSSIRRPSARPKLPNVASCGRRKPGLSGVVQCSKDNVEMIMRLIYAGALICLPRVRGYGYVENGRVINGTYLGGTPAAFAWTMSQRALWMSRISFASSLAILQV